MQEQGISIALALTELFIAKKGRGACRVHGGGFAGVIMAMIPNDLVDEYTEYIENAIGEGNVYRMSIPPARRDLRERAHLKIGTWKGGGI